MSRHEEIVGKKFDSNKWGEFEVVQYLGRTRGKNHYCIKFVATGSVKNVVKEQILRRSVVDDLAKASVARRRIKNKIVKRRKTDIENGASAIEIEGQEIILSIDQALNVSGWALYVEGDLVEYGLIQSKEEWSYVEKLFYVKNCLRDLVMKYDVKAIAMEDTYLGNNVVIYKKLSMLIGIVQVLCYEMDIENLVISIPKWKEYAKIYHHKGRQSQKIASKIKIREKYNINNVPDDITDAILIGDYVVNKLIVREGWD